MIKVFGIRHHGPGSSASLIKALVDFAPDHVAIEGPSDATAMLAYTANEAMTPPVALLSYATDDPGKASYYPFTSFSPEWQAIQYAHSVQIPISFIDLGQSHWLSLKEISDAEERAQASPIRLDPIGALARTAGFDDGETWWEEMIEHRNNEAGIFDEISKAMGALREIVAEDETEGRANEVEDLREAHMRQAIRAICKAGAQKVAVICGAWHAPVLADMGFDPASVRADQAILAKLKSDGQKKIKTEATWIPWTHSRMSTASGYGAGIQSPGWYQHVFEHPQDFLPGWFAKIADLLRKEDLPASSAQLIDAIRLTEALAGIRNLSRPGLAEANDATITALLNGDSLYLRLIKDKLIVGEKLGAVPNTIPMTPLARDLSLWQKKLRIKPELGLKLIELDLRKPNDLDKSRLFNRLAILEIDWADKSDAQKLKQLQNKQIATGKSTFKEEWELSWYPELSLRTIEAGIWGRTILEAAEAKTKSDIDKTTSLETIVDIVARSIEADLPLALEQAVQKLGQLSATASDVQSLLSALPPMARIWRYGDVRTDIQTTAQANSFSKLLPLLHSLALRSAIGLPSACHSLDENTALSMKKSIEDAVIAIGLIQDRQLTEAFEHSFFLIADTTSNTITHLLKGVAVKLLFGNHAIDADQVSTYLSLALSRAQTPLNAAMWLEGFLSDSALSLIFDTRLLSILDRWVLDLDDLHFLEILPLIRRTFASFEQQEKQQIANLTKSIEIGGHEKEIGADAHCQIDLEGARPALLLAAKILGLEVKS